MDNQIGHNLMETIEHGTRNFPFVVYDRIFDNDNLSYITCHWHNEIEILYCYEGSISCTINDKNYTLDKNSFSIINSNTLHQINMIENAKWYAVVFDPKFIYGYKDSLIQEEIFNNVNYNNLIITNHDLINELLCLINTYFRDSQYKSLKINTKLTNLYLNILEESNINEVKETDSNEQSVRVKLVLDYINNNYKNKFTIDNISKYIGLCRSELCRIFKQEIGDTIADYVLKFRIEKSIPLLLSNKLNITEIAQLTGFNSSSYYAEAFRKVLNITPRDYKKKYKK